jgi:phosphatidylethanolamine/phosphatidyl-N-methylethanolamine N-methyltransferase
MKADPDPDDFLRRWTSIYEESNYDRGLAAFFLRKSHEWCERGFSPGTHLSKVIEVGAGTGIHVRYVRHRFDEYWMTDLNPAFLSRAGEVAHVRNKAKIIVKRDDATKLSFEGASFDRLVAAHVLEHLPNPHLVLREWCRVVRPGGIISIVLPCDPGIAWRLGRFLGPRRVFSAAGIAYDYWMAREHINAISNLVSLLRYYFDDMQEFWLPVRAPLIDANLFYIAHVRV